jgi:hypothetical protein
MFFTRLPFKTPGKASFRCCRSGKFLYISLFNLISCFAGFCIHDKSNRKKKHIHSSTQTTFANISDGSVICYYVVVMICSDELSRTEKMSPSLHPRP